MQPASGSAPLHVCGSGSFSTEVRDSRKEKTSGASAILLAVVSVLLTAVLVVMCYIAYQMTVLTPHIVKLSAFVDHHGTELNKLSTAMTVAARVGKVVLNIEAGFQDLLSGSFPRLVDTILSADWAQLAVNATTVLSSISTGVRREINATSSVHAENALRDIGEFTSFGASVTAKLMNLQQQNVTAGDESWEGPPHGQPVDGGFMFGWLGQLVELLMEQTDPQEWESTATSCIYVTDQLLDIDWAGAYWGQYCPDTGCKWDANKDTANIMWQVQRVCTGCAAMIACRTHKNLFQDLPAPQVPPSECDLALEVVCGAARQGGAAACMACWLNNEPFLLRQTCTRPEALEYCAFNSYV